MNEMNLLENQYYTVTVYKDDKEIKKGIQRRFSDFDVLFEVKVWTFRSFLEHIRDVYCQLFLKMGFCLM